MITEPGDYVESEAWDAVVLVAERKPYNMGNRYHLVNALGEIFNIEDGVLDHGSFANHGTTRSDHHTWAEGEKAEYDSLPHYGRTLYDQIRTRLQCTHDETLALVKPAIEHPRPHTTWSN
jgi:hypothetical protein